MISTHGISIMGESELRSTGTKALHSAEEGVVIITKRGKPVAVLQLYDEYDQTEKIIEEFEDFILGNLAKERMKRKDKKFLSLEEMEKLIFSKNE
ncbi:type II toxin-antitoxin system Phd/YefM family antitoxin [Candidatus Peregrinibacteria bacterium]|nr:type II toxin-antitoxin system Phd/YefM family antitoxin [Candidatus Peregrinibacteria bacterium]